MATSGKEPDYYVIRNWAQFQHYKDRNPAWIKMHFALLASEDWVMLDDASRLLAVVCMLVASRHEGRIPNKPAYIKRIAYLDQHPDLRPLIECGFLSEPLADASTPQAYARPETETDNKKKERTSGFANAQPSGAAEIPDHPRTAEPEPPGDGSDEARFWQLTGSLQSRGVARSMCAKLAGLLNGAFDEGVSILSDAASAKVPSRYLGAIIRDRQRANAPPATADPSVPPWVSDARQQGYPVEREGRSWRMAGVLYDDAGVDVGW